MKTTRRELMLGAIAAASARRVLGANDRISVANAALAVKEAPELHVQNFFECVRSREQTNCPAEIGEASALCAHLSTMALREQRMVHWDLANWKLG